MFARRTFLTMAGGIAAGAALGLAKEEGTAKAVEPFGELFEIRGGARERGQIYGQRFAQEIRGFLNREIDSVFAGRLYSKSDLLSYAAACRRVIAAECPIIARELEGMAEGSGLSVDEHVLITLHEELYHRGTLPPVPHCTAVGLSPPVTKSETLVGQTWDWMTSVAGMSTMLHWRRDDGPSLLAYAFPGLWVGAGLNTNGIALCWTSADLGKKNQQPRVGLPAYVILAHLLYQPDLDAVKKAALRNRHAGWFTFVMGDGSGRLLNVEGSPDGITCEESRGQLIRIGFGTRERTGTAPDAEIPRHPRCLSAERALAPRNGEHDSASLQRVFSDPRHQVCAGKSTIDMMVFDTTRRQAILSRGPDYGVQWKEYRFV